MNTTRLVIDTWTSKIHTTIPHEDDLANLAIHATVRSMHIWRNGLWMQKELHAGMHRKAKHIPVLAETHRTIVIRMRTVLIPTCLFIRPPQGTINSFWEVSADVASGYYRH